MNQRSDNSICLRILRDPDNVTSSKVGTTANSSAEPRMSRASLPRLAEGTTYPQTDASITAYTHRRETVHSHLNLLRYRYIPSASCWPRSPTVLVRGAWYACATASNACPSRGSHAHSILTCYVSIECAWLPREPSQFSISLCMCHHMYMYTCTCTHTLQ